MVLTSVVQRLVSKAVFLMSIHPTASQNAATYTQNTVAGLQALQAWYEEGTGLWNTTGWWNSANCLTVLADFAALDQTDAKQLDIPEAIQNTYERAQETTIQAVKSISLNGLTTSSYSRVSKRSNLSRRGFANFLNDYYDDEGWWALALIHSYDLGVLGLGDQDYLDAADVIFEDMKNGTSPCGGIYWSKVTPYTNAIANELFLSVAASLANRKSNKQYYLNIALEQWNWFKNSGMINSQNLVNDGLTDKCVNNNATTWTYNQGVILGGLVELYKATGNSSLLQDASAIATAAIAHLTKDGILYEGCEPNCGGDGSQFKGIFMRNLHYLQKVAPQAAFRSFILANADSIWNNDRNSQNQLGVTWPGPYTEATAGTQSSALDTLVAAMAVV